MSSERPNQTLADYVALAISPALIIGLVASLVFFLVNVFYAGEYVERMWWILFFFVFGAVLVSRMTMLDDTSGRAVLYGTPLGLLAWIALQTFVEYPKGSAMKELSWIINAALIALVWWCAHRLTWDCTNIDEETEIDAEGLLQRVGWEDESPPSPDAKVEKKRTLGIWVVYFSLAALPLFGLGQALLATDDVERRRTSFWLMILYVACGLGLLLTTCFLGLRRYLRQRRLQMPAAMTGLWLAVGGSLIVTLLVLGAVLPRPQAEYSLFSFARTKSPQRSASKHALKGGQAGKGEGRPGADEKKGKKNDADSGGKQGQQKGQRGEAVKRGKSGSEGKGEKSSKNGEKRGKNGEANPNKGDAKAGHDNGSSTGRLSSAVRRLSLLLKWIVFALIGLATLFFVLRSLANFHDWARRLLDALRNFWANLFGGWRQTVEEEETNESEAERRYERPFASFRNPFAGGRSEMVLPELIRYTFAAAQAWARERDLERHADETPLEFAGRVGADVPAVEKELHRLAALYARAVYARGELPNDSIEVLRRFWHRLETVAEQPLSA